VRHAGVTCRESTKLVIHPLGCLCELEDVTVTSTHVQSKEEHLLVLVLDSLLHLSDGFLHSGKGFAALVVETVSLETRRALRRVWRARGLFQVIQTLYCFVELCMRVRPVGDLLRDFIGPVHRHKKFGKSVCGDWFAYLLLRDLSFDYVQ